MHVVRTVIALVLLLMPGAAVVKAQPASPVVDLNTVREDVVDPLFTARDFAVLGTAVFFIHDDGIHGIELWKSDGTAAGTVMVKDVCPGACGGWPSSLTVSNGVLYFAAEDRVHGRELWRSDGTATGTVLVADVHPGIPSGSFLLFDLGGVLYLSADDGVHGTELWKSDGTAAGTVLVADIWPGRESSDPYPWLDLGNGKLLVNANDGVHGREPWISDGTSAGTALLKDVLPGPGDSSFGFSSPEKEAYALGGGAFLFQADDGVHGPEPWISDGTAAGTALLKDVNPGSDGSQAYGFEALGSTILFGAFEASVSWELWATDGTAAGTHLVKDLSPSSFNGSAPRQLTAFGGRLFFAAYDSSTGRELWATDGTEAGTVLVKDINPGTGEGFSPFARVSFRATGGGLLFFADDGTHGIELWASDGTTAGTRLVKDVAPGSVAGIPFGYPGITVAGSTAFFQGFTPDHGFELWKSDGTEAGTAEVKNAAVMKSSLPIFLGYLAGTFGRIGGRFLFDADDGVSGLEPWATDGTAASTQQLADLNPGSGWGGQTSLFPEASLLYGFNSGDLWRTNGTPAGTSPVLPLATMAARSPLVPLGSSWYFTGQDITAGSELWKTDGTAAGTQRVRDIRPGSNGSMSESPTVLGSLLLFSADDGTNGTELWKSDGTFAGTVLVKNISTGPSSSYPADFTPLGPVALFTAHGSPGERDLWVTDGTAPGTLLLKEDAGGLVRLGNVVLFIATHPLGGRELWKTDGTVAGTTFLEDVNAGPGSAFQFSSFGERAVIGDQLFFLADNGVYGVELMVADATGASPVEDIYPGPRSSDIQWLAPHRGRLFFVADDGVHGRELWVYDPFTPPLGDATRMVKDIVPGPGSPVIQFLTPMGRVLLFSATDGVNGVELWQTDGTEEGTVMLQNIAPGAASSSPTGFFSAFPNVYFAANDNVAGFELWSFPRSVLGSTFTDVPPGYWAFPYVEAIADASLTNGCGQGLYCPLQPVTRAEMAVFIVRAVHGPTYRPPANLPPPRFDDVPQNHWAFTWVDQFAADGFTNGCSVSPPLFCPESSTTRAQMAIFLLKAVHGASYTPPPATGTVFTDVPASYWAAAWIERLAAEGITLGCAANLFCPEDPVTREQMAVFLTRAFRLPLP